MKFDLKKKLFYSGFLGERLVIANSALRPPWLFTLVFIECASLEYLLNVLKSYALARLKRTWWGSRSCGHRLCKIIKEKKVANTHSSEVKRKTGSS